MLFSIVAPNPINGNSIEIEQISNDKVQVLWKVCTYITNRSMCVYIC